MIRAAVADEGGIEVDTAGDALFIVFPSAASATLAAAAAQRALTEADWPAGDAVRVRMVHDLRHGFATALLRAGVNVKVVSEALGHSRSSFTLDVYAHVPARDGRAGRVGDRGGACRQFCRQSPPDNPGLIRTARDREPL